MSQPIRYLSVCSGMEAASVAWHHLGWKPVAFSEIEPFPSAILKHHFTQPNYPYDVPNLGSLTEFNTWPLAAGDVDLLVGGTPCQSFSVAGKRGGLNDPRGQLMLSFLDLAAKLNPRYVLWENVPGALSSGQPKGSDFGCFIQGLVERGYGVAWRILDAQYFRGTPQRRRRVFVVAYRDPVTGAGDWKAAAEILSIAEGLSGHLAKGKQTRKGSSADAKGGVGADGLQRTVGTLCADTHPGAYSGQDAYTGRLIPQTTSHWDGSEVHPTLNQSASGCGSPGYSNQELFSQQGGGLVPASPIVIDRAAFNQGENAQYSPHIVESEVMDTLISKGPHAVGVPPMMFKIRGGSPVETGEQGGTPGKAAGKGFLGSEEKAFTIATSPDQWLAQPTAFSFDSLASNSMKSSNPNSGCREVDLSKTIDTTNPSPNKNQGGIAIVHPIVSPTVTTCKGSRGGSSQEAIDEITALHLAQQAIPIQDGREMEKNQNGMGVGTPGDPAYTIDTTGAQGVGLPLSVDFRNNKIFDDPNIAGTIQAKSSGGYSLNYTTGILEPVPFRKSKRAQSTTDNETWVEADASNTLNNFDLGDTRTTHAVIGAVYENHAQDSRVNGPLDVAPTVAAKFGTGGGNVPLVQNGDPIASTISQTVTGAASDAHHVGTVLTPQVPMAVRRLTPVECERLQGFPDNWSRIPWKGKPAEECPDGPRYKACGNSMAVPVMSWIGEAIARYEANRTQG
jgi:site-specific DNA-cytosine methylase